MKAEVTAFETKRDGLTIRGLKFTPAETRHASPAILSHGFMGDQRDMRPFAELLADIGYICYTFDFCGGCVNGTSDGKTTEMSVLTEKRDLSAVIDRALTDTGSDRVILAGSSQGGFVSALAAASRPENVEKLILLYPAFCIPDDARRGRMMFAKFDPKKVPDTFRCGPMLLGKAYAESVMDMDPFREIAAYRGPVLILHGSADKVVNVNYARRAYEAYRPGREKPAGGTRNSELVIIDGAGHGFNDRQKEMAGTLAREFLAREVSFTGKRFIHTRPPKDLDRIQLFFDSRKKSGFALDRRFVIRDGKKHPFALIIPGGGYFTVCSFIEGVPFAKALNRMGISAFILYYRVGEEAAFPAPMDDAARAVSVILENAGAFGVETENYSVWGSSAGGHLAAAFGTEHLGYRRYGLPKPGSIVLAYPVITMDRALTHMGTRDNLLGVDASEKMERLTSIERHVTESYPRTYVWCGDVDATVPACNTRLMADALRSAGVPYECEIFRGVDHGVGPGTGTVAEGWIRRAAGFAFPEMKGI